MRTTVAVLMVAAAALLACKLGERTKAEINCRGSAGFGMVCAAKHNASEQQHVCWKVRFGCPSGGFDVPACVDVGAESTTNYALSREAIGAVQTCSAVTTTSVVDVTVTAP